MFDSPLQFCRLCRSFVALDEGFDECQRLHGCEPDSCPLARTFADSSASPADAPIRAASESPTPEAIALAVLRQ